MIAQDSQPNRPKIVHAFNNLGIGGVETICLEVLRHFSKWSDNSLLVLDTSDQSGYPAFEALGLPVITLTHCPGQHFQLIQKSYSYFRQNKTDALICWSFGNHAFLGLGARLAGVSRIIASVQNSPPLDRGEQAKWLLLGQLGRLTMSHLVACSDYVRDRLIYNLNLPASKTTTIYNGCNILEIHRRAQIGAMLKPNEPIIGMVARLNQIKDQKTLIEAMPLVLEKHPTAELWLVGDGEQRNFLEQLMADLNLTENIKFLGNRHDVPELLGQMDVFAFSTTAAEGFGIVLAEALAAGLPIVASHVGPCAEVLKQGKWGILVEPAKPNQFANAILQALSGVKNTPDLEDVTLAYDSYISAEKYWKLLFSNNWGISI
jgi:glycosyltransferase involved in cell wall biosynthesis